MESVDCIPDISSDDDVRPARHGTTVPELMETWGRLGGLTGFFTCEPLHMRLINSLNSEILTFEAVV